MCENCTANTAVQNENYKELAPVLAKYAGTEGSLITILQKAQALYGYLSVDLITHIARETGQKPAKVFGVATFYTQFRLNPIGKHLILLCQGTACHVNGSKRIEDAIKEVLECDEGQTTEDGVFTYNNVACLGCCSLSPVMMIDGQAYGSLTPDKAKKIITDIRKAETEVAK